jgi:glycosyltransferase involved in cell wall biosynthesis
MVSQPLRILQIMECTIGGTRRHIREIAAGLALRGHDVTAVCSADRDPTFRDDMAWMGRSGVRAVELPMVRRISPLTDLRHLLWLYRYLRRNRFDIIHTHSSKAGVLGRFAGLMAGCGPLIHTPHTFAFTFKEYFNIVKSGLFLQIERLLGHHTARIVNVSKSERRQALRFRIASSDRMAVVENGIDPWPYRWSELPKEGNELFPDKERTPRLGTVGLLNVAKGHHVLLHAFSDLLDRFPDAGLAIVGEGELRKPLEFLIKELGLEGRAFLAGYRDDVPSLLKELDLFVLPSLWEGMPYVLLEAMAAHVPVVATEVNGSRDIVEHGVTGLLVPQDNPHALTTACSEILADPEMARALADNGLRHIMVHYTLDRMLDRIEGVYHEAIKARRRS